MFAKSSYFCIDDKGGTVIAPSFITEEILRKPEFKDKLYIHDRPVSSKPQFLAFGKQSKNISAQNDRAIWNELKTITHDHVAVNLAFVRATHAANYFLSK